MNFNMNFLAMLTFIYGLTGERISIQVFRSLKKEAKQKNRNFFSFYSIYEKLLQFEAKQQNGSKLKST